MEKLVLVNKYTRAGKMGRLIFCPNCFASNRVYHFAWAGLWCNNKHCKYSIENSPNNSVDKYDWRVQDNVWYKQFEKGLWK